MDFTKEQLSDVFVKHIKRERGLQDLMELMIESMMTAERRDFLDTNPGNKGNGFRQGNGFSECFTRGADAVNQLQVHRLPGRDLSGR